MIEEKIMLDQDIVDNLQKFAIDVESRQSLLSFMIEQNMYNSPNFKKYQNEYQKLYAAYSKEKKNFQEKYIIPILIEKNISFEKASWRIDFDSKECIISIEE